MPPPADAQLHTTLTSGITNEWEQIQNPEQRGWFMHYRVNMNINPSTTLMPETSTIC